MNERIGFRGTGAALVLLALAGPGWSQEQAGGLSAASRKSGLSWSVDAGAGYTDNANLQSGNSGSDTILRAGGSINYAAQGRRSGASLDGNVGWEDYSNQTSNSAGSNGLVGRFAGSAFFAFIPDALLWTASDSFSQTRRNAFDVLTPANREYVNTFSTGPSLRLRLGGATSLGVQATYGRMSYENSPFDSDVKQGSVSLTQRLSRTASVSLNASAQRYESAQSGFNSDYDIQSYYAQFSGGNSRTQLGLSLGVNQLHDAGRSESGTLVSASLQRRLGLRSAFSLSASQNFSSAGDSFRGGAFSGTGALGETGSAGGLDPALLVSTSSPLKGRAVTAGWSIAGGRTDLSVTLSHQDDRYTRAPQLDRRAWYSGVYLNRRLRPTLTGRLYVDGFQEDLRTANRNQDEIRVGTGLAWKLGRQISLALDAGHTRRKLALGGTGSENRAFLSIVYSGGTGSGVGFPGRGLDPGGMDSIGGAGMAGGGLGR